MTQGTASRAPRRAPRHADRRAFTVVELVLAMVLSAIIVSSALSVFWMLTSAEERASKRFDDQDDLLVTQFAVRRAMGMLIAAKPREPEPTEAVNKQGDPTEEAELAEPDAPTDDLAQLITDVTGDSSLADALQAGFGSDRPNFELYYEPGGRMVLPALEVKVMESPVPPPPDQPLRPEALGVQQFLPVRGVFEAFPLDDALAIQWRPIDPPGPPTILIRGLLAVEWQCLPHKGEWTDLYAAYLQENYPAAVRLLLWTKNGAHVDWLFDLAATTLEGDS